MSTKVTPEEASVYQERSLSDPHGLAPMLERARVVGVLDAWVTVSVERSWECIRAASDAGWYARCFAGSALLYCGAGSTPDAARAAAAKAIEAGEV